MIKKVGNAQENDIEITDPDYLKIEDVLAEIKNKLNQCKLPASPESKKYGTPNKSFSLSSNSIEANQNVARVNCIGLFYKKLEAIFPVISGQLRKDYPDFEKKLKSLLNNQDLTIKNKLGEICRIASEVLENHSNRSACCPSIFSKKSQITPILQSQPLLESLSHLDLNNLTDTMVESFFDEHKNIYASASKSF